MSLTGRGHKVEAFGECFYYGYEFSDSVEGSLRSAFIKYVIFSDHIRKDSNLTQFIQKAVNELNRQVNIYDYDLVIMPESSNEINKYMLRYIYRFAQPSLHHMELVKSLPVNISFDMESYEEQYLNDVLENGRPRYTEAQKNEVKKNIINMMELIHKKDYFTIAKDVKKSKLRPYRLNLLRFKNKKDENLYASIRKQNVLIVDDVTTSGATLGEILRTIRIFNDDTKIFYRL